MSKMSQIKKDFLSAMKDSGKEKTKPYDSTATVTRIEGNTAWVHIDGGIDETPVQLTIDAKAGDTVKVRVSGGQAWLTGNGSAPPTDDTVAKEAKVTATDAGVLAGIAKQTADQAGKTATNYISWSSEYGLVVSEDATEDVTEMTGGNTRITSDGMAVYSGQNLLASFGTETAIYTDDGTELAHFGYDSGTSESGTSEIAPYYTLGERKSGSTVGNYSLAEGQYCTASGYASHAEGQNCIASDLFCHAEGEMCQATNSGAHAQGEQTIASGFNSFSAGYNTEAAGENQTVIGKTNVVDNNDEYAFIIGNGDDAGDGPSNALTVDWSGNLTCGSMDSGKVTSISVSSQSSASGSVNFNKEFSDIPVVVASFSSNTTGSPVYDFGNCSVSVYNVSTTGFDYRVFNAGSVARSPSFSWIAMLT